MRRILLTTAATLVGANLAFAVTTPSSFHSEVLFDHGIEEYQELRTVLHDWVRESLAGAREDAEALSDAARENGLSAPQVEREIAHWLLFESPRIVSVLREDYAYEGGANGSIWLIPVNWDREEEALIAIESVLGEPDAAAADYDRLAALLREATAEQVWAGNAQDWQGAIEEAIRADPTYLATFTFVPSTVPDRIGGIAWHFEPYAVAPGARGVVSVVIPQDQLRELVEPEWRALMAGEPAETVSARSVAPEDTLLQSVLSAAQM